MSDRQEAKERAILLALQHDMALLRDGLVMYGMKKDGSKVKICTGSTYETLWQETLKAVKELK